MATKKFEVERHQPGVSVYLEVNVSQSALEGDPHRAVRLAEHLAFDLEDEIADWREKNDEE